MNSDLPEPGENSPLQAAIAKIRAAGLRITQPRVALLSLLLERTAPASIEALHREIQKKHPPDLVTVYRNLAAFEELGLVRRLYSDNGTFLWQIVSEGISPYLIISKVTADSEPLDSGLTEELKTAVKRVEDVLKTRGYRDITHKVQFFALKAEESKG